MNRPIIALCLLAALVAGCFWSDKVMENEVSDILAAGESGTWDKAYEKWEKAQPLFGALLPHQALDDVDRLFIRVMQAQQDGQEGEYALSRAELQLLLQELPTLDDINLKNVL